MRAESLSILRYLRMKTVLVANLALVALVAWGFMGEYARNRALQEEIAALDARAEELRKGNDDLVRLREKLSGEGELEREARLKLNLQKPGEEVIIIRGDPTAASARRTAPSAIDTVGEAPVEEAPPASNAERWWTFFFKQH